MSSFSRYFLKVFKTIATLIPMTLVWMLIVMVYFDRFIPPLDRFKPVLMPWKNLAAIPAQSMEERMQFMQGLLDSSITVSNVTFAIMVLSFLSLSIYLTFTYQQKQRRSRENQLLQLKNQEIARRNEFIRYISATIGHEFKNNLGRIKRRLDLVPGVPPEARIRLDENMDKLFADIDIFKRISDERETMLLDFTKINLRDMLQELAKRFSDLADISFHEKFYSPTIFAASELMTTVFENLIDNAIKYKKHDQEKARISLSCSVETDRNRSYVTVSFKDEGIGMDEQQADGCFYKKATSGLGWGQGLYFVKYVIGLHAGKIRIGKDFTALERGTEIIISLPLVEENLYV
jgi:signal transduction histidine kinase